MEFMQVMQTAAALVAIGMILAGSEWLKGFLRSRIQ